MSVLQKSLHPDEKYKAGKLGSQMTMAGLGIGAVLMVISIFLGLHAGDHMKRFMYAYVVGWSFIFSICVGVFWLILLHYLVRGRWATAVRRIAEACNKHGKLARGSAETEAQIEEYWRLGCKV